MNNLDVYKIEQYEGTMESLENIVKNLKLESHEYNFDVINKYLLIIPMGLHLRPGDHYQYLLPQPKF